MFEIGQKVLKDLAATRFTTRPGFLDDCVGIERHELGLIRLQSGLKFGAKPRPFALFVALTVSSDEISHKNAFQFVDGMSLEKRLFARDYDLITQINARIRIIAAATKRQGARAIRPRLT